jgi:hypothetical protein
MLRNKCGTSGKACEEQCEEHQDQHVLVQEQGKVHQE